MTAPTRSSFCNWTLSLDDVWMFSAGILGPKELEVGNEKYLRGELGAAQHNVQTSNRRWREDEFLLSRSLTEGRSAVRVRIEFAPRNIPLYPGYPMPTQAWSEYRYAAYCYLMPSIAPR